MKRSSFSMAVAMAWILTGSLLCQAQVGGGAGAGRGGQAVPALNRAFFAAEYETISAQLALTEDQKAKLQAKVDKMNQEIDGFLQNAPTQIAAGRRATRGAGQGNAAGARGAAPNPVVIKLQDDLQLLINEHQVRINQDLTPEQRLTWETYKLTRVLDPRWQPLGLTDDQKDKIKTLVDDAAKTLAALTEGKTIQSTQGKLYRKIIADVLTDAQLGKLMEGALPVQGAAATRGAGGRGNTTNPVPGGGGNTGAAIDPASLP